jgi:hypothetical protein
MTVFEDNETTFRKTLRKRLDQAFKRWAAQHLFSRWDAYWQARMRNAWQVVSSLP